MREHVANHFRLNNVAIGSTYNSHPVSLASAYATLQVFLEEGILQHVQALEPHFKSRLQVMFTL